MKKIIAALAVVLAFTSAANAEFDVTAAAQKVKTVADDATAKIEAKKAEADAKKAEEQKAAEAKKAEQQKAIDDAKASLGNLKDALSK